MRIREPQAGVLIDRAPDDSALPAAAGIATVVSLTAEGVPAIQYGTTGPAPARLAVPATRERLELAIAERQQVVVVFEDRDPARPIIVGFIEALAAPDPGLKQEAGDPVLEADVDGRRVRVTAKDEIVLQCGSASITLRRNGRIIVRGTYVETHSEGTNRIKGGQVQIN